jgi:mono/diheme cytochrome c family protein
MFAFAHLPESERQAVVDHVRALAHAGLAAQMRKNAGADANTAEINEDVASFLKPGALQDPPPPLPPSTPEAVDRGKALYRTLCAACHGETGRGDGAQDQKNDDGLPTRPRDFGRGIFKGGREHRQLYNRIMLGMPGSPMPSFASNLPPAQVNDLILFVLSLSDPSAQGRVEHQRVRLVAPRAPADLGPTIPEEAWQGAPAVRITVSPLWWRDHDEPDLHIQALHDSATLALRLTWQDRTRNDQAIRPQDFEDMAAVQFFKGSPEPFLGMGAANQAVDVWLWRASWQGRPESYADVDTAHPNMSVDYYPFEKLLSDRRHHPTLAQPREFLTAQAAGNLRSDPTSPFTGNNLQARGLGTLTMRPKVSQVVGAHGLWENGRWTVALRRSLTVGADDGLPLAPGEHLSFGVAIWDGAAHDRNGQKLVSIWHDLELQ